MSFVWLKPILRTCGFRNARRFSFLFRNNALLRKDVVLAMDFSMASGPCTHERGPELRAVVGIIGPAGDVDAPPGVVCDPSPLVLPTGSAPPAKSKPSSTHK
jgi:hypothetical protein